MRLVTKILSFLMLLVLLTAEDCGNNSAVVSKEDRLNGVFQNIESDFAKDELSGEILSAFEKRAIQKLKDITDYINIYADTSLSVQFRSQANQMIQENFYEKSDVGDFYKGLELLEDTVNGILYYSGKARTFKTAVDSIVIIERLRLKSNSNYEGEIQFSQKICLINAADTVSANNFQFRLNMMAIKTKKTFGDKTEDVWEVYFGEIKL